MNLTKSSLGLYKKECIDRYISGCSIRQTSPLLKDMMSILVKRDIEIPFFDLNVNNLCTLKCKRCDQGMPYLNKKCRYTAEDTIANMKKLLSFVDYIYQIGILGGEPFINKDLAKVINWCASCEKIGSIIVVTNGTIFPGEKVLKSLKNKKIILGISYYPIKDDSNRIKLMEYCERNGIHYHIRKDDWLDFGDFRISRNYNRRQMKKTFQNCFLNKCVQYNNGTLYRCTKTHLLKDQKIDKPGKWEVISVKDIKSKKEMKKSLKKFYSLKTLRACNYCNSGDDLVLIPLGEQL